MEKKNNKWILVAGVIGLVFVLALLGGQWTSGQAVTITVPTIPQVVTYDPHMVRAGSGDFVLTIHGSDFNPLPYVTVRALFPLSTTTVDFAPFYVSPDGTTLQVTIPAAYITVAGEASFWVVNNPTAFDSREIAGPLTIDILHICYLPLMSK